jgi:putative transposase
MPISTLIADAPSLVPALPYKFGVFDRLKLGAVYYCHVSTENGIHKLQRLLDPDEKPEAAVTLVEAFTDEMVDRFRNSHAFRLDEDYFKPGKAVARVQSGLDCIGDLPETEMIPVLYRYEFSSRFLKLEGSGIVNRSDEGMERATQLIHAQMVDLDLAKITSDLAEKRRKEGTRAPSNGKKKKTKTKPRTGKTTELINPPCGATLLKWVVALEQAHMDPLSLRDGRRFSGNRKQRLHSEILTTLSSVIASFASETRPPKARIWEDFLSAVKKLNERLEAAGLQPLKPCSKPTVYARIAKMRPWDVVAGREGLKAARDQFKAVGLGLGVTRPLERVEMDEWKIDLQTILQESGVWEFLPDELRADVPRCRLWLCVAIDVATKVILAMRIGDEPDAELALATLEMAVSDKSRYANAVGAISPWFQCGKMHQLVTDAGAAFRSRRFRFAALALGVNHEFPPGGIPELRASIERMFGTFRTAIISRCTGQTFSNVVELGEYPAEERASLTVEQLSWILVRWVIDIYHNTPHSGLGGETPNSAWERKSILFRIVPPPNRDQRRAIFGIRLRRMIGARGVRVLGLHFNDETLQQYRRENAAIDLVVKVDPEDVGHVSIELGEGGGWLTVACMRPELIGVSVRDWIATARDLRSRFSDAAQITTPIVLDAVDQIRQVLSGAVAVANIGSTLLSSDELNRAETELMMGFELPDPSDGSDQNGGADFMSSVILRPDADRKPSSESSQQFKMEDPS